MEFVTCNLLGPGETNGKHNFGLCNQMFQIATALSLAEDRGIKAIFPEVKKRKFGKYTKSIFKKLDTSSYKESDIELDFHQPDFGYCEIPDSKKIRLNGYFQSEKFFKHNRDLILDTFMPSKKTLEYIKNKYGNIIENSVSCHVRLEDYVYIEDHHTSLIKTNYYKNALSKYPERNILIFSDNILACKNSGIFDKYNAHYVSGEKDVIDLYLMSMCTDNIIANSSFSWWGAWLNNNLSKNVFYPDNWFGPEKSEYKTSDLIPDDWNEALT